MLYFHTCFVSAYCSEHTDYCNNRGTCSQDNNNVPSCTCNSGFYGNRCESKESEFRLYVEDMTYVHTFVKFFCNLILIQSN